MDEELVSKVHDELRLSREHREEAARTTWFARSPFKEMLAHGSTLCLATVIALVIHHCTGTAIPITIEAKEAHPPEGAIPSAEARTVEVATPIPPLIEPAAPTPAATPTPTPAPIPTAFALGTKSHAIVKSPVSTGPSRLSVRPTAPATAVDSLASPAP